MAVFRLLPLFDIGFVSARFALYESRWMVWGLAAVAICAGFHVPTRLCRFLSLILFTSFAIHFSIENQAIWLAAFLLCDSELIFGKPNPEKQRERDAHEKAKLAAP